MVATANDILSSGIYTIEQIARLARLSPRILHRWYDGDGGNGPALIRHMPKNNAEALSFVDFVQALAIRALRKDRKLSLQKIREAIQHAETFGIKYPFARKHQTFLFSDEVVLEVDDTLVTVTGKHNRQQLIRPVVELYLDDLTFDDSGLAMQYVPLREGQRHILINPSIKFGAPIVMPCCYTAASLINAVESEGSIKGAAEAFEVAEEDVKFALRYDDFLAGMAA